MIVRTPWYPEVPDEIAALCRAEGLELLGVTDAAADPEQERVYREWLAQGRHGSMEYLERHAAGKFSPAEIVPGVQSIIFVALNYYQRDRGGEAPSGTATEPDGAAPTDADDAVPTDGAAPIDSGAPAPQGRIARYAWGRDYHKELGKRLKRIARELGRRYPADSFRAFTDATPLSERHYAERAGIGFTGRHTLVINGDYGSWFFLGEILSTRRLPASEPAGTHHGACPRTCVRCIDVCPTGALTAPYQIDASRCISYLTIEHRGVIPEDLRPLMGEWLFGCDLCQEVCPLNVRARETDVLAFVRPIAGSRVSLRELLTMRDHETFVRRFAGSPLMRPGWRLMLRNAAIVTANTGATQLIPELQSCLTIDDAVVREHVSWAIEKLSGT